MQALLLSTAEAMTGREDTVQQIGPFEVTEGSNGKLLAHVSSVGRDAYGKTVTQKDMKQLADETRERLLSVTLEGEKSNVTFDPDVVDSVGVLPVLEDITYWPTSSTRMVFKSSNLPALRILSLQSCAPILTWLCSCAVGLLRILQQVRACTMVVICTPCWLQKQTND
jgi:hypothetical protein